MRCEYSIVFLGLLCTAFLGVADAECGYKLETNWVPLTDRIWYNVLVESGTPPPFMDLHVETCDDDPANYELVLAPEGWQLSIVGKGDGSGEAWISLYTDTPHTSAFFKIEYTGSVPVEGGMAWVLTDDGDPDPDTGVIPGEGGDNAIGPRPASTDPDLKVAVHVMPHADRRCNQDFPALATCSDIVSTCSANDVDFFPVFFGFEEYLCFEYSVEWPGSYSCLFTACTYSFFGDIVWPAGSVPPGDWTDNISQCHEECYHNTIAIPGWGWIYEPGPVTIRIVPNSVSHLISVADCGLVSHHPGCNYAAGIGGATGEEPCGPSATEAKTWGAIKALFK